MVILLITLLLVLILISISSINVNLNVIKENKENKVVFKINMLYGLIRFKKELGDFEFIKKNKDKTGDTEKDFQVKMKSDLWTEHEGYTDVINFKKIKRNLHMVKKYKSVIKYVIHKINFSTLSWKTEVGFDDAAFTGLAIGMINILKSNLLVILKNIEIKPKNIYFKVIPDFNSQILKTNIHSIFKVKIGYIIIAGLKFLWVMIRKK